MTFPKIKTNTKSDLYQLTADILIVCFLSAFFITANLLWMQFYSHIPEADYAHHFLEAAFFEEAINSASNPFQALLIAWCWPSSYPPGLYIVTYLFSCIFGSGIQASLASQVVFLPFMIAALYFFYRKDGIMASLSTVLFAAAVPTLFLFTNQYILDYPSAALTCVCLAALNATNNFSNRRVTLLFGAFLGYGILIKYTTVWFVVPGLFLLVLMQFKSWKEHWKLILWQAILAGITIMVPKIAILYTPETRFSVIKTASLLPPTTIHMLLAISLLCCMWWFLSSRPFFKKYAALNNASKTDSADNTINIAPQASEITNSTSVESSDNIDNKDSQQNKEKASLAQKASQAVINISQALCITYLMAAPWWWCNHDIITKRSSAVLKEIYYNITVSMSETVFNFYHFYSGWLAAELVLIGVIFAFTKWSSRRDKVVCASLLLGTAVSFVYLGAASRYIMPSYALTAFVIVSTFRRIPYGTIVSLIIAIGLTYSNLWIPLSTEYQQDNYGEETNRRCVIKDSDCNVMPFGVAWHIAPMTAPKENQEPTHVGIFMDSNFQSNPAVSLQLGMQAWSAWHNYNIVPVLIDCKSLAIMEYGIYHLPHIICDTIKHNPQEAALLQDITHVSQLNLYDYVIDIEQPGIDRIPDYILTDLLKGADYDSQLDKRTIYGKGFKVHIWSLKK